jgi:hypothetical protein
LAVDLPAGTYILSLRFLPRSALFGFGVSLVALVALLALAANRSRLAFGLSMAVAPLLFVSSLFFYDEPWPEAPPPRNADGTLIHTAELPPTARSFLAQFDLPILIEGADIPLKPDRVGISHLALYLRVLGHLPHDLGISVHFYSNKKHARNADHRVIGGSLYLNSAPRGVLLRDAFSINLKSEPGERWKVFVSLWHASGNRLRVPIRSVSGVLQYKDQVVLAEEIL